MGAQAAAASRMVSGVVAAGGGTSGVGAGAAAPVSRGSGTSGGWCGVAAKLDAVLVKMDQLLHKYQSLLRST
jgi:hypothetical protein